MEKLTCLCCGAPINRATMSCEYCGTKYKEDVDNLIKIETYRNPVVTLSCQRAMDKEMIYDLGPEVASKIVLKEMARELAESIAPMMKVETEYDIAYHVQRVRGTVKIIQPIGGSKWNT